MSPNAGVGGGGEVAGSQPINTAVQRSPNKLVNLAPYLTYGTKAVLNAGKRRWARPPPWLIPEIPGLSFSNISFVERANRVKHFVVEECSANSKLSNFCWHPPGTI
jgi:hypothetical protein